MQPVLIDGVWRDAQASGSFQAENPTDRSALPAEFPISTWADCDDALKSAAEAAVVLRRMSPDQLATFLERFATLLESGRENLVAIAHRETALPVAPRLADVELPRTVNQLRLAAAAAREGTWQVATIDTKNNIRSCFGPIGPVAIFGPNNFPFAYNSVAGGDFAAAIAAGNPVIAKANPAHPATTLELAKLAAQAVLETGLPPGTVQLLYHMAPTDGERLVSDPRLSAIGYTGSQTAGLRLKAAADAAGKPIYLELSSVNPVVILPGALQERLDDVVGQFTTSCLMATGQFCTNPGLVLLLAGAETEQFLGTVTEKFNAATPGTLLSRGVMEGLQRGVAVLLAAGAKQLTHSPAVDAQRYCHPNTLLRVTGQAFLADHGTLQTEAFGNASLMVICDSVAELCRVIDALEGNLTGAIYSDTRGADEDIAADVAFHLRPRVGRLINDKMPTGVAVSPAMNHGGPYPSTGHPGFTAVGIPAAIHRFAMLQCYDAVRQGRLPPLLQDRNPGQRAWRYIDGNWTRDDVLVG